MKSLLALAFLLFALPTRAELVNIDSAELARLIAKGVPVIDIRTKPEWDETGIVPGSHPLTFFDEKGDADPAPGFDAVEIGICRRLIKLSGW